MNAYSTYFKLMLMIVGLIAQLSLLSQTYMNKMRSSLQDELNRIVEEYKLPGMTMAVVFNESQQVHLSSGFSDKEHQERMQPTSRMFSGSVGKVFVSALVLKLVDEKKLSLQAPLSKFFGTEDWFDSLPNAGKIKVENLLNHTSGLPRYIFQQAFLQDLKSDLLAERTPLECLAYIFDKEATHAVGADWGYSDTNYLLLGLILEKILGIDYYQMLREVILGPMDLVLTEPSLGRSFTDLAQGYTGSNNPFGLPDKMLRADQLVMNPAFEWTGGGVVTNVLDMARFVKHIHEGSFLSPTTKKLFISAVSTSTGQPFDQGYGLGTFVWSKKNDTRYGHAGFFPGKISFGVIEIM